MKSREIWDIDFPGIGRHPCLILTNEPLLARITSYTVAAITSTNGPSSTHIPVGEKEGCEPSFINVTDLRPVHRRMFRRRRGSISWPLSQTVNQAAIDYLDLHSPL